MMQAFQCATNEPFSCYRPEDYKEGLGRDSVVCVPLWTLLFPSLKAIETLPRCCFNTVMEPIIQRYRRLYSKLFCWEQAEAGSGTVERAVMRAADRGCLVPFNKVLVSRSAVTCDRVQTTHWSSILSVVSQYRFSAAESGIFCAFRTP